MGKLSAQNLLRKGILHTAERDGSLRASGELHHEYHGNQRFINGQEVCAMRGCDRPASDPIHKDY